MALLHTEGFDWSTTAADYTKRYVVVTTSNSYSSAYGRNGTNGWYCNDTHRYIVKEITPNNNTIYTGAAFNLRSDGGVDGRALFAFGNSTGNQVRLCRLGGYRIGVRRNTFNSATIVNALDWPLPSNTWFYLEMKLKLATVGAIEIRYDGYPIYVNDNINTLLNGNEYITRVHLGAYDDSWASFYADDWYVCDSTGTTNNSFMNDVHIKTLKPDGDAIAQWVPTPAGTHYTTVDDTGINSTDYISTTIVGSKDQFTTTDLTTTPLYIKGVNVTSLASSTSGSTMNTIVSSQGTEYQSTAVTVPSSLTALSYIAETDPATDADWSVSNINAMQVGFKLDS